MKNLLLVVLCILAMAVFGMTQTFIPQQDVLGAHNNGGRGCTGCHATHSGAFGNGGNAAAAAHALRHLSRGDRLVGGGGERAFDR